MDSSRSEISKISVIEAWTSIGPGVIVGVATPTAIERPVP